MKRSLAVTCFVAIFVHSAMSIGQDASAPGQNAVAATEKLPKRMKGEWSLNQISRNYKGAFEVSVEENGTGTLSFDGLRCKAQNSPMTWSNDGTKITFSAAIGICGKGVFVFTRGKTNFLEGTYDMDANSPQGTRGIFLNPI